MCRGWWRNNMCRGQRCCNLLSFHTRAENPTVLDKFPRQSSDKMISTLGGCAAAKLLRKKMGHCRFVSVVHECWLCTRLTHQEFLAAEPKPLSAQTEDYIEAHDSMSELSRIQRMQPSTHEESGVMNAGASNGGASCLHALRSVKHTSSNTEFTTHHEVC